MAMSETQGRKLHGAAAAAAAKKASGEGATVSLADRLGQLSNSVSELLAEARQATEVKRAELEEAQRNVRMLEAIEAARDGKLALGHQEPAPPRRAPATGGTRAPRAEGRALQAKIKELLKGNADGKPVAQIINEVGGEGQRVRNQLAQLVKKGELARHASGLYSLP